MSKSGRTGGTLNSVGDFNIATVANSSGTVNVNSGSIWNHSSGSIYVGGTSSGLGGSGVLNISGGFLRNNGTITSTTGNLIIDAGGVVRGGGVFDVNAIVRQNGGLLYPGNSPALTVFRNASFTNTGPTAADLSNASNTTGLAGSANPAGYSGWGVTEYGTTTSNGSFSITATTASKAVFKFNTVTDMAPRNTYGPAANFNPSQSYTWVVARPLTTDGLAKVNNNVTSANQNDFTTQNTTAAIVITDTGTSQTYSVANNNLTMAVLNQYLTFDPSAGTPAGALGFVDPNTMMAIQPSAGSFSFGLGPDSLGNLSRIISLTFTLAPEPACVLLLTIGASALGWLGRRTWRRGSIPTS